MPMTRTELHQLVDTLPDESLPAAPHDDEELTDEDLRAGKETRSEPAISWSDAESELKAG